MRGPAHAHVLHLHALVRLQPTVTQEVDRFDAVRYQENWAWIGRVRFPKASHVLSRVHAHALARREAIRTAHSHRSERSAEYQPPASPHHHERWFHFVVVCFSEARRNWRRRGVWLQPLSLVASRRCP